MLEELAFGAVREAVELERVLAHVQVGLEGDLAPALREPQRGRRGVHEIADAADVEDEPFTGARDRLAAQPGDHPAAARSRGGASAWQIATARASEAWCELGAVRSPRIAVTIRCT